MWLVFGIGAIIFAGFNVIWAFKNKNAKWFRFFNLSITALTVCSFYADGAIRVVREDWGGLMDIMPTMSKALRIPKNCHGLGKCSEFLFFDRLITVLSTGNMGVVTTKLLFCSNTHFN